MRASSTGTGRFKNRLPNRLILPAKVGHGLECSLERTNRHFQNSVATSKSPVTTLSASILVRIYNTLSHPRDQIAFALTCASFAATANDHSATDIKPGNVLTPQRGTTTTSTHPYRKEDLLADLCRWGFIRPTKRGGLKLCRSCWTYLPRQRLWQTREGRPLKSLKRVDWAWAVMLWANGGGKVCPTCQIPEGYDDAAEGMFLQKEGNGRVGLKLVVQTY